jgi:hypothetical protein
MRKLHIYYRHYNVTTTESHRPDWFTYEKSLKNLISNLQGNKGIRLNLVMDSPHEATGNWINKYKFNFHNIHNVNEGSDWGSFQEACKIVKNDKDIEENDLIYFVENDYIHLDGWYNKVIEWFETYGDLHYLSLYDHKDKYFLTQYQELMSRVVITETHHWKTTPSTCGTFILSKQLFDEDFDILSTMQGDHNKWLWLTENRNRLIITPIPGLATHCMRGLESPTIKWNEI